MAANKKTQAIGNVTPPVAVEYDWGNKGQRRTKRFEDAHEAKAFYTAKDKAGKNPKVIAAEGKPKKEQANAPEPPKPRTENPATDVLPPMKPVGVRPMRTRPYLAGVIIQQHGLAAGVTDAMVAELDEAYGKPNPTESQFCLKNAWHAARGFTGESNG